MPVTLVLPNFSFISKRPSPLVSRSAATPPSISATYKSPLGATAMCRAWPRPSATRNAQNPAGSVIPPLFGSQAGASAARATGANAPATKLSRNSPSVKQFSELTGVRFIQGVIASSSGGVGESSGTGLCRARPLLYHVVMRLARDAKILLAVAFALGFAGAQSPASVWDGVYSEGQAGRGAALYQTTCASCHGDKLQGKGQTPALAGADFVMN